MQSDEIREMEDFLASQNQPTNPELENFLSQVDSISDVIRCLSSQDRSENERGMRKADILLQDDKFREGEIDEEKIRVKSSRTVINKLPEKDANQGEMSQDGFMKMVEKDAKERATTRKMRKEKSDKLRDEGIQLFRKQNFPAALDRFSKAIEWTKDSPLLYNNRALTYIRLKIYSKAIEDCDKALFISETNLKARLYKAKAYFSMDDISSCENCLREALEKNPDSEKIIQDYKKEIFSSSAVS
jgi:tetratricopeptide (TPR) repeat protein